MCSLKEDAHRTNTMLASFTEHVQIKMPVAIDNYKEIFIGRKAPLTQKGRKKAIIHWVAAHMRDTKNRKCCEVKRHIRGIQEFEIDGMKIKITPN
jgi:hypothetical protein